MCIYIYITLWSLHHFSEEFLVFFTHTCSLEKYNVVQRVRILLINNDTLRILLLFFPFVLNTISKLFRKRDLGFPSE